MGDDYIISEIERDYINSLLEQNKRLDGREFNQARDVKFEIDLVKKAEGSAIVTLGGSKIIVGVKAQLGSPFPDTPDTGVITTGAELSPMASPYFESGPPSDAAIELARVTDRAIRESHCIDLSKLCVIPKKSVWILFIDFYVLNHDGNLFDAAVMGTVAALSSTKIPKVKILEDDEVEILEELEPLKLDHYPISVTSYKIGNHNIIDANFKEVDFILTPTTPELPFKIGEKENPIDMYMSDWFAVSSSLAGLPALSVPFYTSRDNLTAGIQVIGKKGNEKNMFRLAKKMYDIIITYKEAKK